MSSLISDPKKLVARPEVLPTPPKVTPVRDARKNVQDERSQLADARQQLMVAKETRAKQMAEKAAKQAANKPPPVITPKPPPMLPTPKPPPMLPPQKPPPVLPTPKPPPMPNRPTPKPLPVLAPRSTPKPPPMPDRPMPRPPQKPTSSGGVMGGVINAVQGAVNKMPPQKPMSGRTAPPPIDYEDFDPLQNPTSGGPPPKDFKPFNLGNDTPSTIRYNSTPNPEDAPAMKAPSYAGVYNKPTPTPVQNVIEPPVESSANSFSPMNASPAVEDGLGSAMKTMGMKRGGNVKTTRISTSTRSKKSPNW